MSAFPLEPEHGWIAGILDGEGSVRMSKQGSLEIAVQNTSHEMLEVLEQLAGGTICGRKPACDPGCPQEHVHKRREAWTWRVTGERAAVVLRVVLPLLTCKRFNAERALQAWEGVPRLKGIQERAWEEMHVRGWETPDDWGTRHGEIRHYARGCRCRACKDANTLRGRAAYARKRGGHVRPCRRRVAV